MEVKVEDFVELKDYLGCYFPSSLLVYSWLDLRIHYPDLPGPSVCLVDTWPSANIVISLCDIWRESDFKNYRIINVWSRLDGGTDTLDKFVELDKKYGLIVGQHKTKSIPVICGLDDESNNVFIDYYENRQEMKCSPWPCYQYWIPPEKRTGLKNCQIVLPDGFVMSQLDYNDIDPINELWAEKHEGSAHHMRVCIEHLPYACIRNARNGDLAAFVLIDSETGAFHHLFTLPEYRRKGLGKLVEMQLIKQLLDRNLMHLKFVYKDNVDGLLFTAACPWWEKLGAVCRFIDMES